MYFSIFSFVGIPIRPSKNVPDLETVIPVPNSEIARAKIVHKVSVLGPGFANV